MAFRIATNVASLNTQRWLSVANAGMSKALERLSSGYKINKAADDAAGIGIATKLNVKAVSIEKAIDNGSQAIAMLQTAESGIDQIKNILTRLKELATQAASDNITNDDRYALNVERDKLETEINKIAENTKYGSTQLLKGTTTGSYGNSLTVSTGISAIDVSSAVAGAYTLSVTATTGSSTVTLTLQNSTTTQTLTATRGTGLTTTDVNFSDFGIKVTINSAATVNITSANVITVTAGTSSFDFQLGDINNASDQINISIENFRTDNTSLLNLNGGKIDTKANAQAYLTAVDTAITKLNTERGNVGAAQNQITYHLANLEAMYENTKAAESTIKDADFAAEMANFTKFQIVTQSGVAMLAQANQLPQLILSLMR